ncbi:hypothetical protein SAMN04488514_11546 [Kriegella aquimaris]|uniref:Uncharacterized protein n=1 Tax=Kriegella aquimaris TaxID=192904 RepID=A0A1G9WC27_9FLAO|nr:hypothetical protein SAMN04488514_11546 [Kriegella aquimaris]
MTGHLNQINMFSKHCNERQSLMIISPKSNIWALSTFIDLIFNPFVSKNFKSEVS